MERTCGDCTMCCHVLGVRELAKPALRWCEHCDVGKGCKIYEARPQSCRDFSCLWLTHPEAPEAMRPLDSGVVVWLTAARQAIALTRRHDPTAWRRPVVLAVLRRMARQGVTVVAFSGSRAWAIGPAREEELPADAVKMDGDGLNEIAISAEVRRRVAA